MTAGEGTTICSRYFDVLFQGKAGSLIINAEKVIFRPKEGTVESGKPTSRSWRWAAIDRVEVLAASSSSSYRQLKLKSSGNDKKAITLSIPGGILDDVLQDMNRRLDVEGPPQKSSSSKPNGHRRRSMSRTGGRSMSHRTLSVDPQNNKKDNSNKDKDKDKPAPARRLQRTRSRSLTDLDQRKKQSEGGNNNNPRRQRRASRRPTATSTSSTTGNTRGEREMSSSARGTRDRARERDLSSSAHGPSRGNRELSSSAHGSSRTTHRNSLSGLSRLGGAPNGATGPASRQSSRSVSRSQRRRRSSLGVPVVASAASVVSSARSAAPSSSPLTTPPSLLDNTASRRSPSERRRRSSATTARRSPSERRRSPSTRSRRSPSTRSRRAESPVAKLHGSAKVVSASTTTTNNSRRASAPMVVTTPHSVTTNTNSRRASAPMVVPTTSNNVNVVSSIVATNTRPRRKSESPSTIEKIKESAKNSQQKAEEETRVVPWDDNNDDDDNHPKKGLFKAAQQKLKPKYPLLKPPEKYRQIGEEDSSALSNSNHNNNNHKSKPQRGFLNFMKAPPTRKSIATSSNVVDEIAQMEAKAKQQAARRRSLVESNQQRKASLRAKKDRLTSPQQQHAKGKVPRPDSIQLAPMVLVTKVPSKNNHNHRDHNNNPADNNHSPIASKRRDIVVKPQQDDTSRTSASSTPDSPTKDHNHNRSLVQAKPPNPALWNPNSPEHKFRMMILHHAATCQVANGGACPYDPICCDFKRVLRHMESCNDPNCTEDKCKPTREFLVTMRLMTTGDGQDQQSHKDFLVGMGAMAPIPVIDVGEGQGSHVGDWDAFSMVSESSWWSKAGA